ncbi:MFS transporter [bacterium]|nr:MFS transporter [bacterium]|tara:strand:+ start:6791 stop:7945 length:1155 start_codon:yes stop_codon:yes gene_type:complete
MNILLIYIFLDVVAFSSIIISVLPFHAKMLGAGPFLVTIYISTFSFIQFFASPFLGKLSDKFGRKPLLVSSSFADLISHLIMSFASTLPLLFASRLIAGLFSCNISVGSAYVSDLTTSEERTKHVGRFNSAYSLGFAIGPLIGGYLAGSDSLSPNYFNSSIFAAIINIINLFILIFFLQPTKTKIVSNYLDKKKDSIFSLLKKRNLTYLFILYFSINFVFSGLNGIFALWSEARFNWGPQQIGIMMTFVGILLAFHQSVSINLFVKKLEEKRTIFISIIFIFIGIYTLTISFNYLMLSIAIFFCTMGIGILNPTINSLVSMNSDTSHTGSALSINQSGLSIARFTGQPFSGFFFQNFSINTPLYIGLFILLLIQLAYSRKLNSK